MHLTHGGFPVRGSGHVIPMSAVGLMARFESMEAAGDALKALENQGVDGADLTLVGGQVAKAREVHTVTGPDRRVSRRVLGMILRGGVLGLCGGLLVSAAIVGISVLLFEDVRQHELAQVMVVVAFGMLGAVVGIFATVERGVGLSESWHLAFQDVGEGEAWLAVLDAPDDAEDALRTLGASEVVRPPTASAPLSVDRAGAVSAPSSTVHDEEMA